MIKNGDQSVVLVSKSAVYYLKVGDLESERRG
jgi:hypothetical protein